MKQNILIVGYNYELSKRIAEKLAIPFSMRVFDQLELFLFDHMPRSFSDVCKDSGTEYIKKKLKSILKMELGFEDAIFVADLVIADNCSDLYHKIKLSNFVVFVHKNKDGELEELKKKKYPSKEETEFFAYDKNILKMREESIEKDCADISVDIENLTENEIVEKIISEIENFYKADWLTCLFLLLKIIKIIIIKVWTKS